MLQAWVHAPKVLADAAAQAADHHAEVALAVR